ncbi:hypothetical protein ACWNYO_00770 [Candidatus Vidania fulgoroideorum]
MGDKIVIKECKKVSKRKFFMFLKKI